MNNTRTLKLLWYYMYDDRTTSYFLLKGSTHNNVLEWWFGCHNWSDLSPGAGLETFERRGPDWGLDSKNGGHIWERNKNIRLKFKALIFFSVTNCTILIVTLLILWNKWMPNKQHADTSETLLMTSSHSQKLSLFTISWLLSPSWCRVVVWLWFWWVTEHIACK